MKILRIILPVLVILIPVFFSCTRPIDVETPRKKIPVDAIKIKPVGIEVAIEENGTTKEFTVVSSDIKMDTASNPPVYWMEIVLQNNSIDKPNLAGLRVERIVINMDSLDANGQPVAITGSQADGRWAQFKLIRSSESKFDTITYSGSTRNNSMLSFAYDPSQHKAWSILYTNIYDQRISAYDTTETIWDTLGNGNIVRIDSTYEIVIRENDTLILKGDITLSF